MTLVTPTSGGLADHQLHEIAERIRARIRRTVADILDTGRDLVQVKAALDHGQFTDWIEREFSMSMRSAQRFMQAAEWAEGKNDIVSHLPPNTLHLLAAKSTPEDIQTEVVSTLKAGKSIDPRQIEARIGMARAEHRIAARQERQRAARSPAAKRYQEREKAKWEAKQQARKERINQGVAEAVQILLRLTREDLDRLVEIMREDGVDWPLQEALERTLEDEHS